MKTNNTTIELSSHKYEPARNVTVIMTAEVDDTTGARDGFTEREVFHAEGASQFERNADVDALIAKLNE
jgi:hypothetical protein